MAVTANERFIGPKGDTRIRVGDVQSMRDEKDVLRLSLYEILMGDTARIPTLDKSKEVKVNSLNLKGLALIEREFGGLEQIPERRTVAQTITLIAILINQDRDESEHLSTDDVGRLIDGRRIDVATAAIQQLLTPKADAPPAPAATGRAGSGSSTSSSKSSARLTRARSGGSA